MESQLNQTSLGPPCGSTMIDTLTPRIMVISYLVTAACKIFALYFLVVQAFLRNFVSYDIAVAMYGTDKCYLYCII